MKPRHAAVVVLTGLLAERRSLTELLEHADWTAMPASDRALARALCFGVARFYYRYDFVLRELLQKPLKARDTDIKALVLVGLHQLCELRIPDHAAIAETVDVTKALGKPWARGLTNALLRNFQRRRDEFDAAVAANAVAATAHPRWLLDAFQEYWPTELDAIVAANNRQAPMVLRINAQRLTRAAYLKRLRLKGIEAEPTLRSEFGIELTSAVNVELLPGFAEGDVSVQDTAAQLAADLVAPQAGERLLDACAAPGGKTAHLLERAPGALDLLALDSQPQRLTRIRDNLDRLGLQAQIAVGDAGDPAGWWDGQPFDRILLDVPCSASGVIRRHPDIKFLRNAADLKELTATQARLLNALWPLLKTGGILLYSTCSVLPPENALQIERFLAQQADAELTAIPVEWGRDTGFGRQILPGEDNMDGFFYALLHKTR